MSTRPEQDGEVYFLSIPFHPLCYTNVTPSRSCWATALKWETHAHFREVALPRATPPSSGAKNQPPPGGFSRRASVLVPRAGIEPATPGFSVPVNVNPKGDHRANQNG